MLTIPPGSNGGKPIDIDQLAADIAEIRARLRAVEHTLGNQEQSLVIFKDFIRRIDLWMEQHSNSTEQMEALIAQGSAIVDAYVAQQQGGA
jgi:hypothetical protein